MNLEVSFFTDPFPIKVSSYGTGFLYLISIDTVTPNISSDFFFAHNALKPNSSSIVAISPP